MSRTNKIQGVDAPVASEGWAYGRLGLADDRRSSPGWYPQAFAQCQLSCDISDARDGEETTHCTVAHGGAK